MSLVETKNDLLKDLMIDENYNSSSLEILSEAESKYLKDLRINKRKRTEKSVFYIDLI